MKTYYEILEVSENASIEVIKASYRALSKKYHPDVNQDNIELANDQFKLLTRAYEVLSDPKKRSIYDAYLSLNLKESSSDAFYDNNNDNSSSNSYKRSTDDENQNQEDYSSDVLSFKPIYDKALSRLKDDVLSLDGYCRFNDNVEFYFLAWMGYAINVLTNDSSLAERFVNQTLERVCNQKEYSDDFRTKTFNNVWGTCNRLEFLTEETLRNNMGAGESLVIQALDFLKTMEWETSDKNTEVLYNVYFDTMKSIADYIKGKGATERGNEHRDNLKKPKKKLYIIGILAVVCIIAVAFVVSTNTSMEVADSSDSGSESVSTVSQDENDITAEDAISFVQKAYPEQQLVEKATEEGYFGVARWDAVLLTQDDNRDVYFVVWDFNSFRRSDEESMYAFICYIYPDNKYTIQDVTGLTEMKKSYLNGTLAFDYTDI